MFTGVFLNYEESIIYPQHSGLGMIDPSPPVTFDPPRGHSGMTPTGPVLQMTPDLGMLIHVCGVVSKVSFVFSVWFKY